LAAKKVVKTALLKDPLMVEKPAVMLVAGLEN
jgi:hypothetical protein